MRALLPLALLATACAPSRASLYEPVRASVTERTGIEPHWRGDWRRPAPVDKRVREVLAAPLTADGAALVAVLNSSDLQAVYEDLATAGAAVTTSRAAFSPELEAQLRFPLEGHGNPQIELSAIQDVTALLAMIPRSRAADADLRATRREVVGRTVDLAARARIALYDAAAASARLALRRGIADTATAAAELARKLHEAGNITDLDLLRETLFEEESLVALRGAEADDAAAREALNAVLGLSGDETGWKLADRVLEAPVPRDDGRDLEREAVAASLDLEALRWRLEAAGGRVAVARLESFLPHLGAGVSVARESDESWHAGPAVRLALPLFDWGQGRRAAAWADVRRLQHRYTAAAIDVRASARATRQRLLAAEEQLARIREKLLPLRERLIDESVKQYNAMNLGPFELLIIRREQIEIENRHIDAMRDAWIARTAAWQLRAGSRPEPSIVGADSRPMSPAGSTATGGH